MGSKEYKDLFKTPKPVGGLRRQGEEPKTSHCHRLSKARKKGEKVPKKSAHERIVSTERRRSTEELRVARGGLLS